MERNSPKNSSKRSCIQKSVCINRNLLNLKVHRTGALSVSPRFRSYPLSEKINFYHFHSIKIKGLRGRVTFTDPLLYTQNCFACCLRILFTFEVLRLIYYLKQVLVNIIVLNRFSVHFIKNKILHFAQIIVINVTCKTYILLIFLKRQRTCFWIILLF